MTEDLFEGVAADALAAAEEQQASKAAQREAAALEVAEKARLREEGLAVFRVAVDDASEASAVFEARRRDVYLEALRLHEEHGVSWKDLASVAGKTPEALIKGSNARSMDRPTIPAPKLGTPAVKAQYGVPYVHSAVYHAVLAFKRQVRLLSANQLFITVRIFSAFFMAIVFGGLYYQVIAPPSPWPLRVRPVGRPAFCRLLFSNGIITGSSSGCCVAAGRRQRWAQQVWALPQCRDAAPVRQHLGDVGRG